jgi:hypothetical protein
MLRARGTGYAERLLRQKLAEFLERFFKLLCAGKMLDGSAGLGSQLQRHFGGDFDSFLDEHGGEAALIAFQPFLYLPTCCAGAIHRVTKIRKHPGIHQPGFQKPFQPVQLSCHARYLAGNLLLESVIRLFDSCVVQSLLPRLSARPGN